MQPPSTSYAQRPDGVNIAYQVFGDGPPDLLYSPGFISHLDLQWTDPGFARFLTRLGSFARVILFDKPGTGVSDPIPNIPTVDERMEDVHVVLDAAGSERAAVMGFSEGASAAAVFAATYPDRVTQLVLYGSFAAGWERLTPDEAEAMWTGPRFSYSELVELARNVVEHWGEGRAREVFAPSATGELQRRFWALLERCGASPSMARALIEASTQLDIREVLPAVHVPTLVLHRSGDHVPIENGRTVASLIPGASFVELQGDDHVFWLGDFNAIVDEIELFLTGARRAGEAERTLYTILFTDIVGSTERAAALGDRRWAELLERYEAVAVDQIARERGRSVKSTGDGTLAVFDGPARAVRCAEGICADVRPLDIEVRAGVHTGECELIGADDIGGLAVHIAARVASKAAAGEVLVSSTVRDLMVGSSVTFAERGVHEFKGIPGDWRLFSIGDVPAASEPIPGPREAMRPTDKLVARLARRAPRAMRLGARVSRTRLSEEGT